MDEKEMIYDHYKETMELQKEAKEHRDKHYVILCILEALSFLFLIKPEYSIDVFSSTVNALTENSLTFGLGVFQTFLWIMIAYVSIKYCQDTLYIERQYNYLSHIEEALSKEPDKLCISREGKSYLNNYPIVLNLIDLFYKTFSPLLFAAINIIRIIIELNGSNSILTKVIDTCIFGVIIIIAWFFFFQIHTKTSEWFKKHCKLINLISIGLHKVLKEV